MLLVVIRGYIRMKVMSVIGHLTSAKSRQHILLIHLFLVFLRRYGTRCARCGRNIHASDWVRRARGITFHLACFSCTSCKRQLSTGEECGLLENRVFCRPHYDVMMDNLQRAKANGEHEGLISPVKCTKYTL